MALLDELSGVRPSARQWVSRVQSALEPADDRYRALFDEYAQSAGMDSDFVTQVRSTPPLGVYAVGLVRAGPRWSPAMLVMQGLAPDSSLGQPVPAVELPPLVEFLDEVGGTEVGDVQVVGIEPPQEYYQGVQGDMTGTLGLPVLLDDDSAGVLTAGHVARAEDSTVRLECGLQGEVAFSDHRHRYQTPVPCADVAAIRLQEDWKQRARPPADLVVGPLGDVTHLTPINRSGVGGGGEMVRIVGDVFRVGEDEGAWGDFFFTDPISEAGDSGALALDQTGRVAGQVVGGLEGGYSIVQAIDYLLDAAGARPDLTS